MCNPTAVYIAGTAISAGVSYANAESQEEAMQESADAKQQQIDERAAARARDRAEQGRAERERIAALAAGSGVTGLNVKQQRQESFYNQSDDITMIEENAFRNKQRVATGANVRSTEINSQQRSTVVNAGINIAQAGYNEWGADPQETPGNGSSTIATTNVD